MLRKEIGNLKCRKVQIFSGCTFILQTLSELKADRNHVTDEQFPTRLMKHQISYISQLG